MCGILFILSYDCERTQVVEKSLLPLLHHRGPDGHHSYTTTNGHSIYNTTDGFNTTTGDITTNGVAQLRFHGTVLHLRGELTEQPLVSVDGHVLIWNGEIFGGDVQVPENANDTSILFEKLQKLPFRNEEEYHSQLLSLFATLQGPWAFVFYDAYNMNLWYGRDYFGRRSLMSSFKENTFSLSSLGHRMFTNEYTEVPAKVLYCLNVNKLCKDEIMNSIKTYSMQPFYNNVNIITNKQLIQHRCLNGNHASVEDDGHHQEGDEEDTADQPAVCTCLKLKSNFDSATQSNVKVNMEDCATQSNVKLNMEPSENRIEINHTKPNLSNKKLLNGTNNHVEPLSNNVEMKCCNCLSLNDVTDPTLNTDVDPSLNTVADQEMSHCKSIRCKHSIGKMKENVVHSPCTNCNLPIMRRNYFLSMKMIGCQFLCRLEEAVRKRVHNLPREYKESIEEDFVTSKVGILFSGGIDSVVLTSLADRCTPPSESIDLINVAFAQKQKVQQNIKKKHQKPVDAETVNFDVPDRITGRTALKELPKKRRWNFIEVDVTLEELQEKRKSRITNLVYPLDSVLDDSIGCAIWFAARGVGRCYVLSEDGEMQLIQENYESPVKVLLTGMGADEQLGGYARHRTKFESSGWVGLQKEMKMELERISARNLGRDDRCISDHGREARFPFLDENVVSFLQEIPVCVKCDPRLPRGVGEKILLREVALSMGLRYASTLPKRAIQFGSKIAKLESSKEKGSDSCKRLEGVHIT